MPARLSERRLKQYADALRRGAWNSIVVAEQLHPEGASDFMGQLAKDWDALKAIIKQKDDAIAGLQATNAEQAQRITSLLGEVPDADDVKAEEEIHQVVTAAATPPATPPTT